MYEVAVDHGFAAAHALRDYKGATENVHGHNFKVRVTVEGERLDRTGLLVDFVDLEESVRAIVSRLDHQFLNEVAPFDTLNPSAENMAKYFCDLLEPQVKENGARIQAVTVWETETSSATYRPT
jgi:6-pyruvoyltetrahydropterin/6-carboxytetrahydropterin synthase